MCNGEKCSNVTALTRILECSTAQKRIDKILGDDRRHLEVKYGFLIP